MKYQLIKKIAEEQKNYAKKSKGQKSKHQL